MPTKMSSASHQQLYTILFIVFVGFVGISIAYPLFPPLFLHPSSNHMLSAWSVTTRNILLGITLAAYPLGQFIGSPIIGACSDKYGRRKILIGSLMGTMIGYFLTAIALHIGNVWLLIACRFLTGLAESSLALAQSIVADIKDINKHRGFGGIMMAASIGYVIGPLLGGLLSNNRFIPWLNITFPFYVATLLAAMTVYFAYKTLPETNLVHVPTQSVWRQFNIFAHLRELMGNRILKILLLSSLIFTLGVDLFYEFGPVYLTGRFFMNAPQIAMYNAVLSITLGLGGILFPQWLALRYSARSVVAIGMILFVIILMLIVATSSPVNLFLLFGLIGFTITAATTTLNVEISDCAGQAIQGKVMGMQMGLRMLGDAMICLFSGFLIIYSVSLPLLLGALAALLSVIIYYNRLEAEKRRYQNA